MFAPNFKKLPSVSRLVDALTKVPYLASRNLSRVVAYVIEGREENVFALAKAIEDVRRNLRPCSGCFGWLEGEGSLCAVCADPMRDSGLLCVVESWPDAVLLANSDFFRGRYHILGGRVSPIDGIGPAQLRIDPLIKRLTADDSVVREVVLALSQTPEGEATASFLVTKLRYISKEIRVSKLATGIPAGYSLEQIDRHTLTQSFEQRRPVAIGS